jgi:DNA-binding NtrC family response regulator
VERLVLLSAEDAITAADVCQALPASGAGGAESGAPGSASPAGTGTLAERAEAYEREVLLAEIKRYNFHMTNVAKALGLERSHLYKKCQQLGIDLQTLRKPE